MRDSRLSKVVDSVGRASGRRGRRWRAETSAPGNDSIQCRKEAIRIVEAHHRSTQCQC